MAFVLKVKVGRKETSKTMLCPTAKFTMTIQDMATLFWRSKNEENKDFAILKL